MFAESLKHHGYGEYRARLKALLEIPESASDLEIHTMISLGFPAARLRRLVDDEVFTSLDLSQIISLRTLRKRIKNDRPLTIEESDRLFRLAHIRSMAEVIFGNTDKASRWLSKPKKRFSGMAPLHLLTTQQGTSQVEEMLIQIAEGFAL
ncbi:antitoxin Xre/MbcA/ParS toxin-binding domain-containing protein [Pseudomonas sp. RW409]|uniref:antitoxin Xre/MbcA/ParS toxin-binding domain-containing protein n=1 Tax=Pseudomonas sp. RW409 TaxID=2202895 RepID=UPI000D73E909|nr:antitoxin Xre/MbcA/ParS toxin-binding domain-containing protein [Pseudomonas sp. RW409]PWY36400.1 antitoxin [Pseudomonas sp. RW409]